MNRPARVVIDTNVVVSASFDPASVPARAVYELLEEHVVLISSELGAEYAEVLARPELDRFVSREDRDKLRAKIAQAATLISNIPALRVCGDPDDDMLLSLAVAGGADCVITGDRDVLRLHPFRGVAILRPSEFLAQSP